MRLFLTTITLLCHATAELPVFPEGSEWETVSKGHHIVEGIAVAPDGTVFLTDVPDGELFKLDSTGQETLHDGKTAKANGLAFGPDGRLFAACMGAPAITAWNLKAGTRAEIPLPTPSNDLVLTPGGSLYCTWGPANAIYHLSVADPQAIKVAEVKNPNGITLSHDGRELWVGEFTGDTVLAFPILRDGSLGPSRPAFKAKVPANGKGLLDGMTPLPDGRLLAATALGLQILSTDADPVLLANPTAHRANYVRLVTDSEGGRWIYAAHEKTVIRRKTLL